MNEHWDRLTSAGKALCPDFDPVLMLQFPGNPVGKKRPRFSRHGHAYTDSITRDAEAATAAHMKRACMAPRDGNLVIVCAFYRSTFQRIDVDNMLKHVCDAANGVLWRDDSQVKAIAGFIDHDKERPRTMLMLGRTELGMRRPSEADRVCVGCGASFRSTFQAQRHCNSECARKAIQRPRSFARTCKRCGATFQGSAGKHTFCSDKCRTDALVDGVRTRRKYPQAKCRVCGKNLSRPGYVLCRAHWLADGTRGDRENPRAEVEIEPAAESGQEATPTEKEAARVSCAALNAHALLFTGKKPARTRTINAQRKLKSSVRRFNP